MFHSAHRKVQRILGRRRDSPNNNKEPEYEYGSVPEHLRGRLDRKDEYLIENGANVFKELVKSSHGKSNPFRLFSLKELQKATNNFSADPIWNINILYRTYRGIIEDRHVVVKICRIGRTLEQEVVSLSLIKHGNVVKLLGCCLETKRVIVVHELPPNGTLGENIFHEKPIPPPVELLWADRLRIATEIADALAYLHSELHITHGSLQTPEAVLLDEFHSAKLGAFEYSEIQNQAKSSINELLRMEEEEESELSMEEEEFETDFRYKYNKCEDADNFGKILLNLLGIDDGEVCECKEKVEILKYLKLNVSEKEMPQIEAYVDLLLRCRSIYERLCMEEEDELSMEEVVRELRRIRR